MELDGFVKIVFFTFYYPPDLCACSFRAVALVEALSRKMSSEDEIHVVTTHPNRYASHKVTAEDVQIDGNVTIHRVRMPSHQSGMISQARAFIVFAWYALRYCFKLKPDFIIGTTSRLMTGVLTWLSSIAVRSAPGRALFPLRESSPCRYFIDLRDIFSETISNLFTVKNRLLGRFSKGVFSFLERRLFLNAAGVNVVSEGFPDYFHAQGIDTSKWSFFPNGVDREFIDVDLQSIVEQPNIKTVLYAGNIGSGQGLELIVPEVARQLCGVFRFQIVGDGSTRKLLEERVTALGVDNVELLPPVGRDQLIQYYKQADILFLHLNDVPAFKRVLPSKIFEYTALGKPIVAGLSGYSAQFVEDNVEHGCLFNPGDIDGCVACVQNAATLVVNPSTVDRFVEKYSREKIMKRMADHILSIASSSIEPPMA
jgi:glycosyltransferase involved in cell wall biosynthesis